jgi:hypothetical protein
MVIDLVGGELSFTGNISGPWQVRELEGAKALVFTWEEGAKFLGQRLVGEEILGVEALETFRKALNFREVKLGHNLREDIGAAGSRIGIAKYFVKVLEFAGRIQLAEVLYSAIRRYQASLGE